jgi:hypothetical protein
LIRTAAVQQESGTSEGCPAHFRFVGHRMEKVIKTGYKIALEWCKLPKDWVSNSWFFSNVCEKRR